MSQVVGSLSPATYSPPVPVPHTSHGQDVTTLSLQLTPSYSTSHSLPTLLLHLSFNPSIVTPFTLLHFLLLHPLHLYSSLHPFSHPPLCCVHLFTLKAYPLILPLPCCFIIFQDLCVLPSGQNINTSQNTGRTSHIPGTKVGFLNAFTDRNTFTVYASFLLPNTPIHPDSLLSYPLSLSPIT